MHAYAPVCFSFIITNIMHIFKCYFSPIKWKKNEEKGLPQGNTTGARDSLCVFRQKVED